MKVKPVKRSSSMSMSANIRKKSFGENGSHNRMKTFKTFVTSRILSRSDLSKSENSLDSEKCGDQAADSSNKPQVNGKPAVSAGVLKARDNFQRRSSRTSFVDMEMVNFSFFLTNSCTGFYITFNVQSLTIAIVFELIYYTNGHLRA